jgi:hypothetical protein
LTNTERGQEFFSQNFPRGYGSQLARHKPLSVIIHDFNIFRRSVNPPETQPELVVNPYAMLTRPLFAQRLKPVPRRIPEVSKTVRRRQHLQLSSGYPFNGAESNRAFVVEQFFGFSAAETLNHILYRVAYSVKQDSPPLLRLLT